MSTVSTSVIVGNLSPADLAETVIKAFEDVAQLRDTLMSIATGDLNSVRSNIPRALMLLWYMDGHLEAVASQVTGAAIGGGPAKALVELVRFQEASDAE